MSACCQSKRESSMFIQFLYDILIYDLRTLALHNFDYFQHLLPVLYWLMFYVKIQNVHPFDINVVIGWINLYFGPIYVVYILYSNGLFQINFVLPHMEDVSLQCILCRKSGIPLYRLSPITFPRNPDCGDKQVWIFGVCVYLFIYFFLVFIYFINFPISSLEESKVLSGIAHATLYLLLEPSCIQPNY